MKINMKNKLYAVLLAGGKGTRLWPISNENVSKSFVRIGNGPVLIDDTIKRLKGLMSPDEIIIVVDEKQKNLLKPYTKKIPKKNILVEPFGRSTASAIGLAAINLDPDDIMAVLPTDAVIKGAPGFRETIKRAADFVSRTDNAIICIGIVPQEASTAYGYIKVEDIRTSGKQGMRRIERFTEKPTKELAKKLIKNKNYLWNAGMFVFKAGTILLGIKKHAPRLYSQLEVIRKNKRRIKVAYKKMKNISIDYQIMEKSKDLRCAKARFGWSDLGSWNSVLKMLKKDKNGNAKFGKAEFIDTDNSLVYNLKNEKVGVVGLSGAIVVNTKNGVLVCDKRSAEKVKKIFEK